jgi:competence protein ComEA
MTEDKLNRFWLLATFLLILIIVLGVIIILTRYDRGSPLEISAAPAATGENNIYVEGAVARPGVYRLKEGDSLETILQASGGPIGGADLSNLRLYVPSTGAEGKTQLIDLNRAEIWLLQSLPGIGAIRAQAIIDYRTQNGPFRDIHEITKVSGIGDSTFEKIKEYITVIP